MAMLVYPLCRNNE